MFFKKLVDKKNDKVEFDIISETNQGYISVTHGCFRFTDTYRFLSSSLDSCVKTLVDKSDKILKYLKEEIDDIDESSVKVIVEEVKTIEDLNKEYPENIEKLEEVLINSMGENDVKCLKREFRDNKGT